MSPFRTDNYNTDRQQFSNLTDQLIKPQLFIQSIDGIEISIQNFHASIRTVLEYSSTPSEKTKQIKNHIRTTCPLLNLSLQTVWIARTLCNQYTTRVKDRFRVLGNESWEVSQ